MRTITSLLLGATLLLTPITFVRAQDGTQSITEKQASHFAALALKCVTREFPNKPEHVMNTVSEVKGPKALHPAFYGCYDWHSSVHGHWMLVRLLKTFPNLPEAAQIRTALKANLTAGFEEQIQKSWDDLVEVLKVRTEEVAKKRESVRRER